MERTAVGEDSWERDLQRVMRAVAEDHVESRVQPRIREFYHGDFPVVSRIESERVCSETGS
jgi:hypothetical protein